MAQIGHVRGNGEGSRPLLTAARQNDQLDDLGQRRSCDVRLGPGCLRATPRLGGNGGRPRANLCALVSVGAARAGPTTAARRASAPKNVKRIVDENSLCWSGEEDEVGGDGV